MGKLFNRLTIIVLVLVIAFSSLPVYVNAASSKNEYPIYKVTVSTNLRESPSKSGTWITTVPPGAYVAVLDEGENSFYHIRYGNIEGYMYMYCLQEDSSKSYDDYLAQFPNYTEQNDGLVSQIASMASTQSASTLTAQSSTGSSNESVTTQLSAMGTVNTRAKFRVSPSVTSEELNALPVGAEVTILEVAENGFLRVEYNGEVGFVYARLVDYDESIVGNGTTVLSTVVVDDINKQNSRNAAGTADVFTTTLTMQRQSLAADASQALTGETTTVAVASAATVAASSESGTVDIEPPNRTVMDSSEAVASMAEMVLSYSVNMRSLPDQDSNKIASLPAGATVTILGSTQGGYTMVQYNGVVGYIMENSVVESVNMATISDGTAILYTVTAYCSCRICCGSYSPEVTGREPHTATGTVPQEGRTIAVDPSVIPYGTSVMIDGYGVYVAEDCGGAIRGNHIDMYFDSHEAALQFGTRRLYVTILQ